MRKKMILSIVAIMLFLVLPYHDFLYADPIIRYQTTHLGGVLWQYDYSLSYGSFPALLKKQGIAIFFTYGLYDKLTNLTISSEWNTYVFDPNDILGYPAPGEFDAEALKDDPTIPTAFSVSFDWLGGTGTSPGSQPFLVYDFNEPPAGIIGRGYTTSSTVPEPGTILLLGCGGAGILFWRKKS